MEPDHYLAGIDQRRGEDPDLVRARRSVARRSVLCQADRDASGEVRGNGMKHGSVSLSR